METQDMSKVPLLSTESRDEEYSAEKAFGDAKKGEWRSVVDAYAESPLVRKARDPSSSHQTLLHMAISRGLSQFALKMVEHADGETLKIEDDEGNTVLHVAASVNSATMVDVCDKVVEACPELGRRRNRKGEWPLLLAAFDGSYEVFKLLVEKDGDCLWERDEKGNNILHLSIIKNCFDVSAAIVRTDLWANHYNDCNYKGETALRILAGKPSAFRSRTPLGMFELFVYKTLPVDNSLEPLEASKHSSRENSRAQDLEDPENAAKEHKGESRTTKDPKNPQDTVRRRSSRFQSCFCFSLVVLFFLIYLLYLVIEGLLRLILILFSPLSTIGKGFLSHLTVNSKKIRELKLCHLWASEVMQKLVAEYKPTDQRNTKPNDTQYTSKLKQNETLEASKSSRNDVESPLLTAAKMGIIEMVKAFSKKHYDEFNVARSSDKKNALLLAVENRQADVFEYLTKKYGAKWEDDNGNNALHTVAKISDKYPWRMPGETMKMHWEIKWYEYVRSSVDESFSQAQNKGDMTPMQIFRETHQQLIKVGGSGEWLGQTSQSCSVVASLITAAAFTSATIFPGGSDVHGYPNLRGKPGFTAYVISAYVALCFSLYSLITFLTLLLSPHQSLDEFSTKLPEKLLLGITTLLISIGAMLVAFSSGHYFFLKGTMTHWAIPVYVIVSLPIVKVIIEQIPHYILLLVSVYRPKPRPWYTGFSF